MTTPTETTENGARGITAAGLRARKRRLEARRQELDQDIEHNRVADPLLLEQHMQAIGMELDGISRLMPAAEIREREARRRAEVTALHQWLDGFQARAAHAVTIAADVQGLIDTLSAKMQELQGLLVSDRFRAQLDERLADQLYVVTKDGSETWEVLAVQLRLARVLFDDLPVAPWERGRRFQDWVGAWTTNFAQVARRTLPARPDTTEEA